MLNRTAKRSFRLLEGQWLLRWALRTPTSPIENVGRQRQECFEGRHELVVFQFPERIGVWHTRCRASTPQVRIDARNTVSGLTDISEESRLFIQQ
jgi:hypothetical protein